MSALQDIEGPDPYAECRELVEFFNGRNEIKRFAESAKRGWTPYEIQVHFLGQLMMTKPDPDTIRFIHQASSPAFLRYIAGLMGSV